MKEEKKNIVLEKSFQFSVDIMEFTERIYEMKRFRMADQIFGSGTSIGANIREAQSAESNRDFIHKMKIAHKEAEEVEYWLMLCELSKHYPFDKVLLDKARELMRIIGKIIVTAKKKVE